MYVIVHVGTSHIEEAPIVIKEEVCVEESVSSDEPEVVVESFTIEQTTEEDELIVPVNKDINWFFNSVVNEYELSNIQISTLKAIVADVFCIVTNKNAVDVLNTYDDDTRNEFVRQINFTTDHHWLRLIVAYHSRKCYDLPKYVPSITPTEDTAEKPMNFKIIGADRWKMVDPDTLDINDKKPSKTRKPKPQPKTKAKKSGIKKNTAILDETNDIGETDPEF